MKVHLFGATSSPSCCNFALQRTVEDHKDQFTPAVTNAVARNMYVDDCLLSVDTEHKAESIIKDLSLLCKKGGFYLEKFSNRKVVLNSVPEADRAKDVKQWNLDGGTLTERALGVYWLVDEDVIGFNISLKHQPITRRGILPTISSIYDPLGIVSPFVMTAKVLLQKLCKSGIKWDDRITGELEKLWIAWFNQVKEFETVKLERYYKPRDFHCVVSCQLHIFADASEIGMGVVIYMRVIDDCEKIHCSFVLGKARVTLLKAIMISRLEFTACTMAVKLIIGANSLLKSIISKCAICKRYQSPPMSQKMANLPPGRLEPDAPPFTRIGMDYFGPFELKRGRSIVKRYGVIFTCLISRALHPEVAFSLDTDSCIDAIRRFIARRGKPAFMIFDNGTNLIGAEREMRKTIHKWNINRIQGHMRQLGIEWAFNPTAASHFGGVWERLIRSVRKVFYSVLHEQTNRLDDGGLITLFCEVEATLNGRPLTSITDDPNDLRALTPNYLFLLRPGEHFPPGIFDKRDYYVRRRWRQIQYLADIFWTRWIKAYIPLLHMVEV